MLWSRLFLGSGRPSSLAPVGRLAGYVLGHRASKMHPQKPQETAAGAMLWATQEVEAAVGTAAASEHE